MRTVTPDEMFEILRSVPLSQITLEENYAAEMRKMWDFRALMLRETSSQRAVNVPFRCPPPCTLR